MRKRIQLAGGGGERAQEPSLFHAIPMEKKERLGEIRRGRGRGGWEQVGRAGVSSGLRTLEGGDVGVLLPDLPPKAEGKPRTRPAVLLGKRTGTLPNEWADAPFCRHNCKGSRIFLPI